MQKKYASKTVYTGSIFTLTQDQVEIKNKMYTRDIIHHNGGVGVLALKDHQILMVKQYRFAIDQETYEIPAGKLEKGEDPYTAGLRELEEESGFTSDKLHLACSMYSTPGFCNEKIYIYWTDQLKEVENPLPMDEDEEIETCWIGIDDAIKMIEDGTLKDAKTIIAVQFAKLHDK